MSQDSATATEAVRKLGGRRRREVVAVLLFSGGPIFESSIPLSVFGIDRQDAGVPRYRLLVCSGEEGPLRTTGGLELTAPYGLEAISRAGTVVVPAWRSITSPPPMEALDALRRAHEEGARIVGLCTGAFVLAAAGLLDGRPATTHWMYAPTLAKRYPSVHVDPRELFVDDGDVLTSAGTAAGIDLCLHIVRSDHGTEAAGALARRLVVPPRRSGGQERYLDRSLPEEIGSDPLAEVVAWALEHLHEQFDVETLAARAYMSRRTFDRRFRSLTGSAPLQWLITQRVLQAQRLLETSDYSVDEVAGRCGFRSPVALRGHFRRQLGSSPAAYRAAYRARRPQGGVPEPVMVTEVAVPSQGTPRAAVPPSPVRPAPHPRRWRRRRARTCSPRGARPCLGSAAPRRVGRMNDRMVWIDCEMTGLSLTEDALIEVAALVTDSELNVLGEGVDIVIRPPDAALETMPEVVRQMHTASGLLDELAGGTTLADAEEQVLAYVREHVKEPGKAPLCGNSVGTDRGFLSRDMPLLEGYLHYRIVDVSSVKELARRWYPRAYFNSPEKNGNHRALADIRDSITELRYYREAVFVPQPGPDSEQAKAAAARVSQPRG